MKMAGVGCFLTTRGERSRGLSKEEKGNDDGDDGTGPAPSAGLYDPAHEHDACGVGFVVDIKGTEVPRHRQPGADRAEEPAASRRLRLRGQHRGRRRHPDSDAPRVPPARVRPARHRAAVAWPLWRRPRVPAARSQSTARNARPCSNGSSPRRASSVLGWRDVATDDSPVGPSARSVEPVFKQVFIGRAPTLPDRAAFERKLYVIRKRAEHAVRASRLGGQQFFYSAEPLRQHAHLQGHALGGPDRDHVPRRDRSAGRVGAGARSPALLDQHASRRGRSRIPTATSPTTARSTRCAATSTGCTRARRSAGRRCSATISRRSCPSSSRAAATPPSSTTCSSSW